MTHSFRASTVALTLLLACSGTALAQEGEQQQQQQASDTERVARAFYDAFTTGDQATMERLYHPDVQFEDPIFAYSDRAGTMGMWRVLTDPASGGEFSYELLGVEGETATVFWQADYEVLGRPVHNEITATLIVRDGQITDHHDSFSWKRWARQALPLGPVSGWSGVSWLIKRTLRGVLQHTINKNERARAAEAEGPGIAGRLGGAAGR
jgi:uncharacterized protein